MNTLSPVRTIISCLARKASRWWRRYNHLLRPTRQSCPRPPGSRERVENPSVIEIERLFFWSARAATICLELNRTRRPAEATAAAAAAASAQKPQIPFNGRGSTSIIVLSHAQQGGGSSREWLI